MHLEYLRLSLPVKCKNTFTSRFVWRNVCTQIYICVRCLEYLCRVSCLSNAKLFSPSGLVVSSFMMSISVCVCVCVLVLFVYVCLFACACIFLVCRCLLFVCLSDVYVRSFGRVFLHSVYHDSNAWE